MLVFRRLLISIVGGMLLLVGTSFAAAPSAITPLDSWVYLALDKLAGLGLIHTSLQGSRPYTRNEIARQVHEGLTNLTRVDSVRVGRELLFRLENNYRRELREMEHPDRPTRSYLMPVRDLDLKYLYQEGGTVKTARAAAGPNVVASQFPLNINNDGIDYIEYLNAQLTLSADARFNEFLLFSIRPQLDWHDDGHNETYSDLSLRNGRMATQLGSFEVSFGRQSIWWGPGQHGALVLSNNAQPFDMLRITNPTPIYLPWFLKSLGLFKFDLFWSRMEEDRVVSDPYFTGLRMELKPAAWFSIGASRGIMFGGENRPNVRGTDFLTILSGKNLSGGEDTSNSVAAVDFRLKLLFLWGMEFYGEVGGEDEAGGWLANSAGLGGIYFPLIEPSGRLSLRLEYADLSYIDNNAPMWYRHGIYKSGYTYEGKLLGHHAGGGSHDYFVELICLLPGKSKIVLNYDFERRGSDQPVAEKHHQGSITVNKTIGQSFDLSLSGKINRITNLGFVDGTTRTDWLIGVNGAFLF